MSTHRERCVQFELSRGAESGCDGGESCRLVDLGGMIRRKRTLIVGAEFMYLVGSGLPALVFRWQMNSRRDHNQGPMRCAITSYELCQRKDMIVGAELGHIPFFAHPRHRRDRNVVQISWNVQHWTQPLIVSEEFALATRPAVAIIMAAGDRNGSRNIGRVLRDAAVRGANSVKESSCLGAEDVPASSSRSTMSPNCVGKISYLPEAQLVILYGMHAAYS